MTRAAALRRVCRPAVGPTPPHWNATSSPRTASPGWRPMSRACAKRSAGRERLEAGRRAPRSGSRLQSCRAAFGEYLAQLCRRHRGARRGRSCGPSDLGLDGAATSRRSCRSSRWSADRLQAIQTADARGLLASPASPRPPRPADFGNLGRDEYAGPWCGTSSAASRTSAASGPRRTEWHCPGRAHSRGRRRGDGGAGRVRPDGAGGMGWARHWARPPCAWFHGGAESRGYIGVGSLGTRSEIAAELIRHRRHRARRRERWLAAIARGRGACPPPCSPSPTWARTWAACAPGRSGTAGPTGSPGAKTWITHAARGAT